MKRGQLKGVSEEMVEAVGQLIENHNEMSDALKKIYGAPTIAKFLDHIQYLSTCFESFSEELDELENTVLDSLGYDTDDEDDDDDDEDEDEEEEEEEEE